MTITKITISCTDDTMGNTSPSDCDAYREWFAGQLAAEYPDAEIEVTATPGETDIQSDDDTDEIELLEDLRAFSNRCWDSCRWEFIDD